MQTHHHALRGAPLLTQRQIVSFHYGPADSGRKAYFQASLHADELPGMLVAHHLRQRLHALESAGRLRGEVVVVPVANPVGLAQSVLRTNHGRFDLASGENFNRHYADLFEPVLPLLEGRLGGDAQANARVVRAALFGLVKALPEDSELMSQRKTLLGLACDAEVVIDLHCDCEALLHLYTGTALWPQAEVLARCVGAQVSLLADTSGDDPFDEACSRLWWRLQAHFGERHPIPLGCLSVTLELRGQADVSHPLAGADADALLAFLTHRGFIDGPLPELPPLPNPATPLNGCDVVSTPISGVVVYLRQIGEVVRAGDVIAEVIDPVSGEVCALATRTGGLLFAREWQRFTSAGRPLFKVAGRTPVRSGKLSSQ